jgi:glycosyltransferase involved in cell wall biosynthesis
VKTLLIEGWRTSPHSYALVNQHQLLHLLDEPRLRIFHHDISFFQPQWAALDSGLPAALQARLAAIPPLPAQLTPDLTYRISYPLRIHAGAGRVFVYGTCEFSGQLADACVGVDGRRESARRETVDIVTSSSWSRRGFLRAGYAADRVHVVPHGANPALALPPIEEERARLRQSLQLRDDDFAFLNVSAMTWNKGIGPLIAAFAVHRRSHPHSVLILKGGDALYGSVIQSSIEEAVRLRAEARDPTLIEALRYIAKNLPWETLHRLYHGADAYVAPYRAEGFNLPVLEAMASGLPVLVTRGGATDDFCPDPACFGIAADTAGGELGEYLEPRIESIIEQMNRVVEDVDARLRRSTQAREHALQQFSWERVSSQLTSVLTD